LSTPGRDEMPGTGGCDSMLRCPLLTETDITLHVAINTDSFTSCNDSVPLYFVAVHLVT